MTDSKAVEALADAINDVANGNIVILTDDASKVYDSLTKRGYQILPTVTDERLREALEHLKEAYGDREWLAYKDENGAMAFATIEAALSKLAELRAREKNPPMVFGEDGVIRPLEAASQWRRDVSSAPRSGSFLCRHISKPHITFEAFIDKECESVEMPQEYEILCNETYPDDILDDAWFMYDWMPLPTPPKDA